MKKEGIIQELYDSKFIPNYVKKLTHKRSNLDTQDAIQHCWLQVLELEEEKLQHFYQRNGIRGVINFVSGIIHRQCLSQNSTLYYTYVKHSVEGVVKKRMTTERWDEELGWI